MIHFAVLRCFLFHVSPVAFSGRFYFRKFVEITRDQVCYLMCCRDRFTMSNFDSFLVNCQASSPAEVLVPQMINGQLRIKVTSDLEFTKLQSNSSFTYLAHGSNQYLFGEEPYDLA